MEIANDIANRRVTRFKLVDIGFWILVTAIFLYDRTYLITKAGLPYFFICSVVRIVLLIALAWINIHWLIPRYLFSKAYGRYFGLVFLLIVAYLVVQTVFDYYLFGFVVGPTRVGQLYAALIYNFTHTSLYLLLTVALKFSIDWYEQQKILNETQVEKLQAEVNYLRSQVNPHFLFNVLNSLYGLTLKKSDDAPGVVLKLSELMEYMLYESDEDYVPLEKEIAYLDSYLELEKLRLDKRADIRMTVTGEAAQCLISPFLLLPLVENAFKHGINGSAYDAYLYVQILIDKVLEVRISNSKPHGPRKDQKGGIGLSNLRKRLELLYPEQHELRVDDQADQYTVTLKVALSC